MLLNTRENPGRYLDHIKKVDSGDLRKAASRYLGRGEYAAVSIVPEKEKKR
jgi:predicted Zn-dependent peptidase